MPLPNFNAPGGFNPGAGKSGEAFPESALDAAKNYVKGIASEITKALGPIGQLTKAIEQLTAKLNGGGAGGMKGANDTIKETSNSLGKMSATGLVALTQLTEGIKSFARAGLQGTGQMAMLDFQTQMMARGVAAVFLPAVDAVTDVVRKLTDWFGKLTEKQQNAIQSLVIGAGAAMAFGAVLGPVGAVIGAIAGVAAGGNLGKLGDIFEQAMGAVTPLLDILGDLFDEVSSALAPAFAEIGAIAKESLGQLVDLLAGVMDVAKPLIEILGAGLAMQFKLIHQVVSAMAPVFSAIKETFAEVGEAIAELADAIMPDLNEGFQEFLEVVKPVVAWIADKLVDGIKLAVRALMGMIVAIKVMWEHLKSGNFSPGDLIRDIGAGIEEVERKAHDKKGGADKAGRQITPTGGTFEDIHQMFKRIQSAAASGAADPQNEIAKHTEKAADILDEMNKREAGKKKGPEPPPMA